MSSTFYFPCLLLLTLFWTYGSADITTSTPLSIRQTLSSPDGSFELGFFSPNTSQNHQYLGIWFKRVTPRVYVWVANRENPVTSLTANLTISSNGTLILLDEKQALLWSSGEESLLTSNQCHAELSNSGNLVVVDNVTGTYLWQSFDHLTDTMLPLSSLMYDIPNNTRRVLTSWRSNTDPSPGEFLAELTPEVPPQGLVWKGSSPYWRSGPWAETRFSGIPEMDETYVNPLTMVQDVVNGTGVLTFCALRNFDVSYIKLTPDGSLDIHRSNGGTTGWIKHFEGPRSSCDLYGTCGPNGLCIRSTNSTPTCECLKGFVPKSDDEWNSGNWTRGCVRRTELSSCQGKDTSDGFYRVANMKPPDSYELVSFGDAEECRKGCLSNCSCLAFSYIKGIGCLVWNKELLDMVQFSEEGEFLFIRLARSELAGSKRIKIVVVSAISLCMFIILGLAAFWCWRYRLKQNGEARVAMETSEDSWKSSLKLQDVSDLKKKLEIDWPKSFSYGKENKNLLAHAWESWSETGGVELLDQDIADSESDSVEAVMRCVQISLLCVQHQAMDRPNIKQVVTMLTSKMDLPKPKQPMFVLDTSDEDSGSKSNDDKDLFSDDENNPVQE
ncbi:G-type lectin S-receptor-like serine/threonine-protein kinase [Raphanus sativus]|nr:G-type lectin S-receptor-like serine/threonine-protein kinase [Raphanus sativus]KAJ4899614.1 G-type lectin S-receptor-like serine/threonine-protein kinase [Raphanus sativus]